MRQRKQCLDITTNGNGLYEITALVQRWLATSGIDTGLLTLFVQHTSASLTIQENADSDVQRDLSTALDRLAPSDPSLYRHTAEGPDDMPAHIKSALTDVSLSVPVADARAQLGTWQGIYLLEHRQASHTRKVILHLIGD